ncbi:hypothetical protein PHLGIDRAFT_469066 [Phlebiopsis gigantea 11061_1 CR5-6]|uniref:WW domain-containing protein n=1 Tax=Phlebiopsis gigantea (strain 11061_1 CR5-6) TaxID=745531 RepID=A0A0C3S6E6_PHLG1|nr:hypothetical protein PHLGIDRAFT_469066 [Phlebiopsis gigantea 11061_1 CR5-6]
MSSSYFAGLPLAGNAPEVSFDTTITHAHGCTPVYPLSGGWTRYVHINGGVYYYHAELRVITERDVSETGDQNIVLEDWKDFLQSTRDNGMIRYVTSDADAVLRYLPSLSDSGEYDGELELAEAFFVCYSDASEVKCPRAGKEDISVQHDTYSYWTHIEEYPMHLHKQRSGVLSKATACFWTAITFLSNEQIERVVEVYEDLLDTWETNQTMTPVLIWYLARIIREVKAMQEGIAMAVGYHSQTEIQGHSGYAIKQLSSTIQQSIRETGKASTSISGTWQLSTAEVLFSVLLLSTHRSYRERLAKTRVAWSVNLEEFRHVIEKMLAEWTDTNLLATVFVGANVSFLSVPNLTAMQRTASLASAIFSLVSIGSGLYHVWHHRTKIRADQVDAAKYVYHVQGPGGRGESDMVDPVVMSFFLAVPVASMLWAVACFSVALAAFCIQGTDSHGRIVLIVVIGVGTTVSLLAALGFKQMFAGCSAISHDDCTNITLRI